MSLKNVLYKKYGIMISEAEASYYAYLLSNSKKKYDYLNVLNEFIDNCTTRYFGKNKVKVITKELIKEEIGRDKHTPRGRGTAPDGKGASGNITAAQLLGDNGIDVEEENGVSDDDVIIEGEEIIQDDIQIIGEDPLINQDPDDIRIFMLSTRAGGLGNYH